MIALLLAAALSQSDGWMTQKEVDAAYAKQAEKQRPFAVEYEQLRIASLSKAVKESKIERSPKLRLLSNMLKDSEARLIGLKDGSVTPTPLASLQIGRGGFLIDLEDEKVWKIIDENNLVVSCTINSYRHFVWVARYPTKSLKVGDAFDLSKPFFVVGETEWNDQTRFVIAPIK